jgi:hypothetical protein
MPVTIIKRAPAREPAPLVEGAASPKSLDQEPTREERIKRWEDSMPPPPPNKLITCKWCGHQYIKPSCNDDPATHLGCMNFKVAQRKRQQEQAHG